MIILWEVHMEINSTKGPAVVLYWYYECNISDTNIFILSLGQFLPVRYLKKEGTVH